jgi:hypothetical protein
MGKWTYETYEGAPVRIKVRAVFIENVYSALSARTGAHG